MTQEQSKPAPGMKVETFGDGGIVITQPDRRYMALVTLKARLRIEIATGLKSRAGSMINHCRRLGYEGPQKKPAAFDWVVEQIATYHIPAGE